MASKRRLRQCIVAKAVKALPMAAPDESFSSQLCPCAPLSSDGTASDDVVSEGALTAMTSVAGMDDEDDNDNDDVDSDSDSDLSTTATGDDGDGDHDDTASLYPASHWPRPPSPHETLMPLYSDADAAASTRSLWVPDLDYREIHGRRYCGEYFMPNDEIEQLRLSLQHHVFMHLLDGDMTCVPLDNPKHILDVGTGTGEWPMRMAELYPDCEVVGTDISAIAETRSVPMNVFFEIEDAEEWDRASNRYDLIHFRCMEGAFRDWPFMYDSVYDSLKPGGWIEVIDFDSLESVRVWLSIFSPDSPFFKMAHDLKRAAEKVGRKRGIAHMDPLLLLEAGFIDVRVREHTIPMLVGDKAAGKLWLISCLDALEANCLRLLTQQMGWDPDECRAACEQAARELVMLAKDPDKAKDLLIKAHTVTARKPLDARTYARSDAQSTSGPSRSPSPRSLVDSPQHGFAAPAAC